MIVGMLQSEAVDDGTRAALFADYTSFLIVNLLFVSLAFWAFGIATAGSKFDVGGISLSFSIQLLVSLIAFFFLVILLPFFVGTQRARALRTRLIEERMEWLDRLLDILEFPVSARDPGNFLGLAEEINQAATELSEEAVLVQLDKQIREDATDDDLVVAAFTKVRDKDPRLKQLDWLQQYEARTRDIVDDFGQKADLAERGKAAEAWAKAFRTRRTELAEEAEEVKQARPVVLVGVGLLLAPLMSLVLDKAAELIWTAQIAPLFE